MAKAKKPKDEATVSARGRPTSFTPILAERVCAKIVEGKSVYAIGKLDGFPSETTVFRWLGKEGPEYDVFRKDYARAREMRAEARFERLRDIGDQTVAGKIDPAAARAAADIEKWCLGRENAPKYGDAMTLKGDAKNPLALRRVVDMSEAELLAAAAGEVDG